jgi:hypothetical protein
MKNTSNIRLVGGEAPSRLLQKHSSARMHLADLINRKLSIESTLRHLSEAAQRLQDAQAAEGNATAALANFEAAETAAMADWSRSPSSPMPVGNPGKRDELEAAIRRASAQAAAARKADAANTAEQLRETAAAQAMEPQFAVVIAEIIDEEMAPLLAAFEADKASLAAKAARIQEGVEALTRLAHQVGADKGRPAFVTLENLNTRLHAAFARLAPDNTTGSLSKWLALIGRLRADPLAKLED